MGNEGIKLKMASDIIATKQKIAITRMNRPKKLQFLEQHFLILSITVRIANVVDYLQYFQFYYQPLLTVKAKCSS